MKALHPKVNINKKIIHTNIKIYGDRIEGKYINRYDGLEHGVAVGSLVSINLNLRYKKL